MKLEIFPCASTFYPDLFEENFIHLSKLVLKPSGVILTHHVSNNNDRTRVARMETPSVETSKAQNTHKSY